MDVIIATLKLFSLLVSFQCQNLREIINTLFYKIYGKSSVSSSFTYLIFVTIFRLEFFRISSVDSPPPPSLKRALSLYDEHTSSYYLDTSAVTKSPVSPMTIGYPETVAKYYT